MVYKLISESCHVNLNLGEEQQQVRKKWPATGNENCQNQACVVSL